MGLAMRGLTHCEKCGKTLNYDEYVLCKYCEEEANKKSNTEVKECKYCDKENAAKIIKDKNIRNGIPILENTRLTPLDVLNFMTEFVLENLDQFNEEIAKLDREQILSCYDYIFERLG